MHFLAPVFFAAAATAACTAAPTAKTRNGTYKGVHSPEYHQDFFLGVPFAQPPIGDLRFRSPRSLNESWDGAREAVEYSSACVGYGVGLLVVCWVEDGADSSNSLLRSGIM